GIRDYKVTGVQTCALPIYEVPGSKLDSGETASRPAGRLAVSPESNFEPGTSLRDVDDSQGDEWQALEPTRFILRYSSSGQSFHQIGRASCRERVMISEMNG